MIKKILLFSFLFFVFQFEVDAQGDPNDNCAGQNVVYLSYQSQVDSFPIINQNSSEFIGCLVIDGNDIDNLDSLSSLQSIIGDLYIGAGFVTIDSGFPSGPSSCFPPPCVQNDNLSNSLGLENLTVIRGKLEIANNSILNDISGLNNVDVTFLQELIIIDNSELSLCNIEFVCNYLTQNNNNATIRGNAIGCDSIEVVIDACGIVGIEELNKNTISIFPNPSSELISISVENLTISQIKIYNQLGQKMQIIPGTTIDVSAFPKGLYIVEIETEDGIFREKVLVEALGDR